MNSEGPFVIDIAMNASDTLPSSPSAPVPAPAVNIVASSILIIIASLVFVVGAFCLLKWLSHRREPPAVVPKSLTARSARGGSAGQRPGGLGKWKGSFS
ncbi:hypothetical protein CH063_03384 [Colletotrichum higginsianum]|uniref:Uncharacterized protein n=2 Tax=Colletotrichum higginsianum TaxID=80884 RepID=H1VWM5_COLHI|nr:hypothetical protein CH63R_00310 [Colletotrichum higginsianum IMI 349063]OBR15130.1 hypothetical protein CH63R_00310 [Colletotrichum higginsianum IMI 349063]TID04657.1 hypothetical protein CH35J_003044 [Colletotrichum higginsianum]CCF44637.1 hypothetical protein CH063_03384 [Colletotrichum higginsianum]